MTRKLRWLSVTLGLTVLCGCQSVGTPSRPYGVVYLLTLPERLNVQGTETGPVLALIHGRQYRALPVSSSLQVEFPTWVPPGAVLAWGIGAQGITAGTVRVHVQGLRPVQGAAPIDLLPPTDVAAAELAHAVRSFQVDLSPLARQWAVLRIALEPQGVQADRVWLVEPMLYRTVPEASSPWAPVEKPVEAFQEFRRLNSRFHVVLVVADRLAYTDLNLETPGQTPWPNLEALLAGAAVFTAVYPVYDDPDRNLAAFWNGVRTGLSPVPLSAVFRRGLYQTYGFIPADGALWADLGRAFHTVEKASSIVSTPDREVDRIRDRLRYHQARREKAFIARILRLSDPSVETQGLDAWLGTLRRALSAEAGRATSVDLCVLGTGRVEDGQVRPGFLACRLPTGVLVPTPVVRAPMSGLDVVPTLSDWFDVSRKDARWDGESRLAWLFYRETPPEAIALGSTRQGGFIATYDGVLWVQDGRPGPFVVLNPRSRAAFDPTFQAFLQTYLWGRWRQAHPARMANGE
ncbi:hypothetical protein HRbin11_00634 [bacterium HR11]|nr:hypothetical protein HRbin11_00634 [bacterium HR11]